MNPKYPSLAFSARDVLEMFDEAQRDHKQPQIFIRPMPTKHDPLRVCVTASAFRAQVRIGQLARAEASIYVGSGKHTTLDKICCDVLWELVGDSDLPMDVWGRFTSITE